MSRDVRQSDRITVVAMIMALVLVGGVVTAVWKAIPPSRIVVDNPLAAGVVPASPPTTDAPTTAPSAAAVKARTVSRAVAPPGDPYAKTPVVQIGTIEIPKIGLLHPIFEGITLTVIDHGPGHWPGTALPGQEGNAVFAGHRVTHTHPFLHIDSLTPGDQVIFHMEYGTFVYEVTEHFIVTPNDLWIADPLPGSMVTFFGCHPPHFATHRYVVRAKLIETRP